MTTTVHFCHGLESGPFGFKVRKLSESFTVSSPDMQMSLWNPLRSNSVARNILRLRTPAEAIADSFEACVEVQRQALHSSPAPIDADICVENVVAKRRLPMLRPTWPESPGLAGHRGLSLSTQVLVGSSWGGAVAASLLSAGSWRGCCVLMCPALRLRERWTGKPSARPHLTSDAISAGLAALPAAVKAQCLIVHGTTDNTVPIDDSRALAAATGIALLEVEGGDHGLGEYVTSGGLEASIVRLLSTRTAR